MTITHSAGAITIAAGTGKASGTATSGTASTLTNTGASFSGVNDHIVFITGGTGAGQSRFIVSSTSTVLTVRPDWTITPDAASTYVVGYDFDDIAAADTAGGWGVFQVHQAGSAFEFLGGQDLFNKGYLADTNCSLNCNNTNICFADDALAGYQFGEIDEASDITLNGVTFVFSNFATAKSSNRNWYFRSLNAGFNQFQLGAFYDCQFRLKPGLRYDVLFALINTVNKFDFVDCVFTISGAATQLFSRYLVNSTNLEKLRFARNKVWAEPGVTLATATFPSNIAARPVYIGLVTNLAIVINTSGSNGCIFLDGQFFNANVGPRSGQAYFDNPVFDGFENPTWFDPGAGSPVATTEIRVRYRYDLTTENDGYLGVYDGTGTQVEYEQASGAGVVSTLTIDRHQYLGATPSWVDKGPHDFYLAKYGAYPSDYQISFTTAVHGGSNTSDNRSLLAYPFVVTNLATATAITGVAITHSPALITVSTSHTLQEVHDWLHYAKTLTANIDKPVGMLAASAVRFACSAYDLLISAGSVLSSSGVLLEFTGDTLTFDDAGDKSALLGSIGTTSAVAVSDGASNLAGLTFESGAEVNLKTGATAATITVAAIQIPNISAGAGVTLISAPVTFSGFPTGNNVNGVAYNAVIAIRNLDDSVLFTADASSGSVAVSLSEVGNGVGPFQVWGDGRGLRRTISQQITINRVDELSLDGLFEEFENEAGQVLVGLAAADSGVTYDESNTRFLFSEGSHTFLGVLHQFDLLTSDQAGQAYDNTAVRAIDFVENAFVKTIFLPSPFTIAATETTASPPGSSLLDFRVIRPDSTDARALGLSSTLYTERPIIQYPFAVQEFIGLTEPEVRSAVGLAAADLDTQLGAIDTVVDGIATQVGTDGDGLTAIPWNASWDAEVQSEVVDGLVQHTAPTTAEFEARTLPASDYFDPDADTVANVTTVGTTTTNTDMRGTNGALTTLGSTAPAGWINPAAITDGSFTAAKFAAGAFDAVWSVAARTLTAIADSSGVNTLLSRLTSGRATNLDNLDATITSRLASGNVTVGAYATGQSPADLVNLSGISTLTAQQVWEYATRGLTDKAGYSLAGSITVGAIADNVITADSIAAGAVTKLQDGLATSANVSDAQTAILAGGFIASDRTALLAIAYNRQRIDYSAGTFTIYAADGTTPLQVFNLRTAGGGAADNAQDAVDRVPQ